MLFPRNFVECLSVNRDVFALDKAETALFIPDFSLSYDDYLRFQPSDKPFFISGQLAST